MVYENLDKVVEYLRGLGWTIDTRYNNHGHFSVIEYPEKRMIYEPHPLMSPLFRGQSKLYDECLSNLYRGAFDAVKHFIERLRIVDFEFLLKNHPILQEDIQAGLYVHYTGFAQHYEMKTELLDLTNSLIVAAFFATTKYSKDKGYQPIIDSNEKGVLYFIPNNNSLFAENERIQIYPLGLQCFKRPGEQRGFTINLKDGKNLNKMPGVFKYEFYQDKNISEQIYQALDNGRKLFPFNPIQQKVSEIMQLKHFALPVFEETYRRYNAEVNMSAKTLLEGLEKEGYTISGNERSVIYSDIEIKELCKQKENKTMFLNNTATTRLCFIPQDIL